MRTSEGMEEPAKNWQIAELDRRLGAQEKFMERVESKIDVLIDKQVTNGQLDQRLDSLQKAFDTEIEKIHLRYGPIAKNLTKFIWGVVMIGIAQVVSMIFNLVNKQ